LLGLPARGAMTVTIHAHAGRDNNFHLIRHAAAAAVVLTHSYSVVTGRFESEPLVAWFGTSIGLYAVSVFFVLSGFLIAQSLEASADLIRFAVSRMLRIFPALMIAVALASLVIGPLLTQLPAGAYFADPDLARHIVGSLSTLATDHHLPGLFAALPESGRVNVPLWTLKYEIAAYISLATIAASALLLGARFMIWAAGAVIMGCIVAHAAFPDDEATGSLHNAIHLFLPFYLGVGAYHLRRLIPLTASGVVLLAGVAVLVAPTVLGSVAESVLIAYSVLWLAFLPGFPTRRLERLGDASYGIYIYAFPIQQLLRLLYPGIEPLALFCASLAVTVPLAFASWHLIEKPCLDARGLIVSALRRDRPTPRPGTARA